MLFHDIIHGMHTPKNAKLTEREMEAAMIVIVNADIVNINFIDKYHGE